MGGSSWGRSRGCRPQTAALASASRLGLTAESLLEEWKLREEAVTDSAEPAAGGDDDQPDNKLLEGGARVMQAQGEDMMMRVLRELRNECAQTDDEIEVVVEEGCQSEDRQAVRAGEARAEAVRTSETNETEPTLAGERKTFFVRDMMVRLPARAVPK